MLKILEENKIIELGVYMNVSLKGTDCLQKSIFFSSYLHIIPIKVVFISVVLLCLQW